MAHVTLEDTSNLVCEFGPGLSVPLLLLPRLPQPPVSISTARQRPTSQSPNWLLGSMAACHLGQIAGVQWFFCETPIMGGWRWRPGGSIGIREMPAEAQLSLNTLCQLAVPGGQEWRRCENVAEVKSPRPLVRAYDGAVGGKWTSGFASGAGPHISIIVLLFLIVF